MSDLEQKLSDSLAAKALEKALHGEKLDFNDGLALMSDDKLPLICSVADIIRRRVVGEDVSFVVSYNMNYSNVCAASCQILSLIHI